MPRATPTEVLAAFGGVTGARMVDARERPFGKGFLVRVEMPTDETAIWARAVVQGAGLAAGGNERAGERVERQVVFTVPVSAMPQARRLPHPPPQLPE